MMKGTKRTLSIMMIFGLLMACQGTDEISYSDDIKPLLNKKCLRCHGGIRALGGFSLLFPEEALAPTESGKLAIVPGKPGASELIRRVKETDPELIMPQEGAPLTGDEIALLEKWIAQGARFDKHWAYRQLEKPLPPSTTGEDWVKNDIDRYILAGMKPHQLTPNEPADAAILLRRLSFDLTGLPPDSALVTKINGKTLSAEIVEQIVDELLKSPHFGEHFGALWLDLARYADSNGYEKDMGRSIWRYRDWVINALNADMPFDQFTIEQLAGDLLPEPSEDQLIATAFHRNTMTNTEGGTEDEEFRSMSVIDRVNTTFEAWQGTTISCVQCHAHPYDPFRLEDYYRVLAIFNNTQDADIDSEYPYLLELPDTVREKIASISDWIHQLNENYQPVDKDSVDKTTVRDLVFPRLFGDFADDFQDVLISDNGSFNNSAYNANNQKHKQYYLVFSGIEMHGIKGIRYHYFSRGDDAVIEVYLDDPKGEPVARSTMVEPEKKDWDWLTEELPSLTGKHDLIFHFVNTTGDFRTGVVNLKEITLVYEDRETGDRVRSAQDSLLKYYRRGIKTPVMKERSPILRRKTQIFERGNYLVKGDEVREGIPEALTEQDPEIKDRLQFARWLVSDDNPLTARVIVNRIWGYIFGQGIVETPEDFGTQGIPPTHPELLDYLAYHFSHSWQWSLKRLIKEMVLSATYQQSSAITPEKAGKDPYNHYYSRMSRIRLSAEQIRDQALAVSGLLNRRVGGKSVMPPQPDGVWQIVYSSAKWEAEHPEDKFRRGLYTYWKRTTPYPSMITFDSPSREFCVSRRIRTNTPLQALVTLNDPVYLETAQALASYMKSYGQDDIAKAIRGGYQKALMTLPDDQSVEILGQLYRDASGPKATLVSEQDEPAMLDPYTVVANAIMNLDAFLTKS